MRTKLHAPVTGFPVPPVSEQVEEHLNDPSLAVTLCSPPLFLNVTVSPALIVSVEGEKTMLLSASTSQFVAKAGPAHSISSAANPRNDKRVFMIDPIC